MSQSKRASSTAASEAIFGSAARGDADTMSDRDILIVDDNVTVLRERAKALTDEGWSVAAYTFAKLFALCGKGALFIQHIKLESSLLVDQDGRLERVLADFELRASYQNEIHENGKLAALAGVAPQGARGCLLAADIL